MEIYIFKKTHWIADAVLPGTPPIGRGKNKYEAIGSLLFALQHETNWGKFINGNIKITEVDEETAKSCCYRADILSQREAK